ncbi:MAG: hypothetical protein ACI9SI_002006 [Polaribacter sp.]|jgi:hypothetical protein
MKKIKLIVLMCIAVSFSQCSTLKLTETAPFIITGASYHNWVGGQPGVSGTNLILGIENASDISIKSIYFRNRKNNPSLENRKGKEYLVVNISTSKRDDTEIILETPSNKPKKGIEAKKDIPFILASNEAVIKYMIGKKIFYYKVSKIKKADTVFYQ